MNKIFKAKRMIFAQSKISLEKYVVYHLDNEP